MAYCTTTNLAARLSQLKLIQLCDDERTAIASTTIAAAIIANAEVGTRLTAAIVDADAQIDRWVRARYSVPFDPVPESILLASCHLAIYNLHARRVSEFELPESVANMRTDTMNYLKAVAKGEADIGEESPPAESSKAIAQFSTTDPVFTSEKLGSF